MASSRIFNPVLKAHPGWEAMDPLPHARCALDDDREHGPARVKRWVERGSPTLQLDARSELDRARELNHFSSDKLRHGIQRP